MEKYQVPIPNGRIIVKQEKKVSTGPINMFVGSDDEKLLRFAKELSIEATQSCMDHAKKDYFEAEAKRKKRKR